MADINQWRRMIQPSRARTPAIEGDDSEGFLSPATPRKALKPKISSYFTQHLGSSFQGKSDLLPLGGAALLQPDPPSWSVNAPSPDAERLVESVMCRLLAAPCERLDASLNGVLLQIFECFRNLGEDKRRLQSSLQEEIVKRSAIEQAMHRSAEQWDGERQEYKAEVKRLELILAKGERGVAEVTLARQDSLIRRRQRDDGGGGDKTLETVFALLERSRRYEEKLWNSQRATMRQRSSSPSAAMRRLSRQLMSEPSTSKLGAGMPLNAFEGLPSLPPYTVCPSPTDEEGKQRTNDFPPTENAEVRCRVSQDSAACSNDSLSTFSCDGDLLPDETANADLVKAAGIDNELGAVTRVAQLLATRRKNDPGAAIRKPFPLFNEQPVKQAESNSLVNASRFPGRMLTVAEQPAAGSSLAKHPTLKAKASQFFSKWKPHLNIDTSNLGVRRFSFEPGDDTDAAFTAPPLESMPSIIKDRLLRKSASTSFLSDIDPTEGAQAMPTFHPLAQSPSAPVVHAETKRASRIPTPVYSAALLARPRSQREGSESSLLTAIKHEGKGSLRSNSRSSSAFSSPVANQAHFLPTTQDAASLPSLEAMPLSNNPLVEHTNALRGNLSATTTASTKAAGAAALGAMVHSAETRSLRIRSRSSSRSSRPRTTQGRRGRPDDGKQSQEENQRPMNALESAHVDQGDESSR